VRNLIIDVPGVAAGNAHDACEATALPDDRRRFGG